MTRHNRAIFPALRATLFAVSVLAISLLANPATATENSEDRIAAAWLSEQGQRYEYGIGVPQQLDRALEYYCQAADLGHAQARFHLGWLYASGRLGAVDEVMAAAWLQAAQAAGHSQAQSRLRQLDALNRILPESARCLLTDALVERRLPPPSSSTANRNTDHGNSSPSAASAERRSGTGSAAAGIRVRELTRADIHNLVHRLAPNYQLDPKLVIALIQVESNFDPEAHSPKDARGLMQLIPATAQRFGVTDIWDPVQNMRGGMAYLRWLLDHFNGNRELALAAYTAGEDAVHRHDGIPPDPETQAYVKLIIAQLESKAARLGVPTTTP